MFFVRKSKCCCFLYRLEAEQLEVFRQTPYILERGRWSGVVAGCDVSHIPLNAGYDDSVCSGSLPLQAGLTDLDPLYHNGVCTLSIGLSGVASVRNNRECSPLGIECPSGAPAALARRVDKPVVPLDSKKLLSPGLSFRSAHDFQAGQRLGGNSSDELVRVDDSLGGPCSPHSLGCNNPIVTPCCQSFIFHDPALNSMHASLNIPRDPEV